MQPVQPFADQSMIFLTRFCEIYLVDCTLCTEDISKSKEQIALKSKEMLLFSACLFYYELQNKSEDILYFSKLFCCNEIKVRHYSVTKAFIY